MGYSKSTDYHRLHERLGQVLPDYRPVSERRGDEPGTFKAIDGDGNIWLVTWHEPAKPTRDEPHHVVRRTKQLAIKAEDVDRAAAQTFGRVGGRIRRDLDDPL